MTPLLADLAAWWLQAGLLLGGGLLLPRLLGLREARARVALGQLLLVAALLLPLVPQAGPGGTGPAAGAGASFSFSILVSPSPTPLAVSLEPLVLGLLAAGVLLRLAWLGVGVSRLRALRRSARPLSPVPPAVEEAFARTGVVADLLVSREVVSPVTVGWLHPAVVLPDDLGGLDAAGLAAVVCHELHHVKRRDAWAVLAEETLRALLWPQPVAWGVLSGIALAREQAVDRAVVAATGERRPYLRALARLAPREAGLAAALPFHTRSHLHRRVESLVKEVPMSRPRLVLTTAATATLLVLVGAVAASAFPLGAGPAPAPPPAKATAPAAADGILEIGGDVKAPVEVSRVNPVYPEQARKDRVQGKVVLSAIVDEKGAVTKLEPVESPDPALAQAAIDAVSRWTYKPATLKGKPVKVRMSVTVAFKLS